MRMKDNGQAHGFVFVPSFFQGCVCCILCNAAVLSCIVSETRISMQRGRLYLLRNEREMR